MSLQEKLFELQHEIRAIKKDSENPYFKSKYFDINKLLRIFIPKLNEKKILFQQPLTLWNGGTALLTILTDLETGEVIKYETALPVNSDPQKMGSAITYFRRYAIQSLFALEAVDDDANLASGKDNTDFVKAVNYSLKLFTKKGIEKTYFDIIGKYKDLEMIFDESTQNEIKDKLKIAFQEAQ